MTTLWRFHATSNNAESYDDGTEGDSTQNSAESRNDASPLSVIANAVKQSTLQQYFKKNAESVEFLKDSSDSAESRNDGIGVDCHEATPLAMTSKKRLCIKMRLLAMTIPPLPSLRTQ